MRLVFCIVMISSFSLEVSAQRDYLFIEPNVSITYDSTLFKKGQYYVNTFYETEAYDFIYRKDKQHKINIHIAAGKTQFPLRRSLQDSAMTYSDEDIHKIKDQNGDSIQLVSFLKSPMHINGFSFNYLVMADRNHENEITLLKGLQLFEGGYCEIQLISWRNDPQKDIAIMQQFLNGWKYYAPEQIQKEDSVIKSSYTVSVDSNTAVIDYVRNVTYTGLVKLNEKLNHTVSQVRIRTDPGRTIFYPGENGVTQIHLSDKQYGRLKKSGEVAVLNSFGKKVLIPFSFTYFNSNK